MLPTGTSGSSVLTVHSSSKRCVAIINPAGGGGISGRLWNNSSKLLVQHLSSYGFAVEQRFTAGPGSAVHLAAEAAAAGADVILAVGGDGTIHEVGRPTWTRHTTFACAVLRVGAWHRYRNLVTNEPYKFE
jgi:hypothetical protein